MMTTAERRSHLPPRSDATDAQREWPGDGAARVLRPPRASQLLDELRKWVRAGRGARTLHRRPGSHISGELRERPFDLHREARRADLVEGKLQLVVSQIDERPLRRPVATDDLAMKAA